jgi:phage I-like protein
VPTPPTTTPNAKSLTTVPGVWLAELAINSASAGAQAPEWVHVLPTGTFKGVNGQGPWTLKDADRVIAASMASGKPVPLDYNHQLVTSFPNGGEAPASGWINRFESRADGIWGHVEWTQRGAQAVASREYRFLSPVFTYEPDGSVLVIKSVALVNTPNLNELAAVASEQGASALDELLKQLAGILGLTAGASQEQVVAGCRDVMSQQAACTAAFTPLATAVGVAVNSSAADIAKAAGTKLSSGGSPNPALFVPMAAFAELQTQVAVLSAAATTGRAEEAVKGAMAAGKVSPALQSWALDYAGKDIAGFTAWCTAAPAIVAPGGLVPTGAPPVAAVPLDAAATAICTQLGISAEAFKKAAAEEAAQ